MSDRSKRIGGSDVAAILGVHPYKTALDLWSEKVAGLTNDVDNYAIRKGLALEGVLLDFAKEKLGLLTMHRNQKYIHPKYPYMAGEVDAICNAGSVVLEAKSVGNSAKEKFWQSGQIPPHYELQIRFYMAISDADRAHLVADLGEYEPRIYDIERDRLFEDLLISNVKAFWEGHVLTKIPPEIDGGERFLEAMNKLHPQREKKSYVACPTDHILCEYEDVQEQFRELTRKKAILRNKIIAMCEGRSGVMSPSYQADLTGNTLRVRKRTGEKT